MPAPDEKTKSKAKPDPDPAEPPKEPPADPDPAKQAEANRKRSGGGSKPSAPEFKPGFHIHGPFRAMAVGRERAAFNSKNKGA